MSLQLQSELKLTFILNKRNYCVIESAPSTKITIVRRKSHASVLWWSPSTRHFANPITHHPTPKPTLPLLLLSLQVLFVRVRDLQIMIRQFVPRSQHPDIIRNNLSRPIKLPHLSNNPNILIILTSIHPHLLNGTAICVPRSIVSHATKNFDLEYSCPILDIQKGVGAPRFASPYGAYQLDHVDGSFVGEYQVTGGPVSGGGGHGILDHFDGDGDEGLGIVVAAGFVACGGLLGAVASRVVVVTCCVTVRMIEKNQF